MCGAEGGAAEAGSEEHRHHLATILIRVIITIILTVVSGGTASLNSPVVLKLHIRGVLLPIHKHLLTVALVVVPAELQIALLIRGDDPLVAAFAMLLFLGLSVAAEEALKEEVLRGLPWQRSSHAALPSAACGQQFLKHLVLLLGLESVLLHFLH